MKDATPCPNCGKPTPAGALAGLCPACLLAQGAETEIEEGRISKHFEPPPISDVAKLFPQLEILGLLGAGGMGAVYKARQPALDRIVALKVLPAAGKGGANFAERFNREARALARLSHPNIVAVFEFGETGGLRFFIMEYVDGANLRQLEQAGRLSPREALQIIPQICDALQYAHDEGVVHRDIKPENVLVDRKGRVKIADFGLAKMLGQDTDAARLTAEGQVMGTPHYMAPEQIERPLAVDHRADIYALGVVLYEMLTGDLPLGKFPPPSRKVQVDVRLDEVVLRALENDPARRYQQASEVKSQVETIAGTPAEAEAASGQTESAAKAIRWAGVPVVIEDERGRRVRWGGAFKALVLTFAVLTLVFAPVSWVTGRSLFGWFGVIGWPSLVARLVLASAVVAWGVWRAWGRTPAPELPRTPQGTVVLPPESFSRKAVFGFCWAPFFFLAAFLYFVVHTVTASPADVGPEPSVAWWQIALGVTVLPLGLAAPFGTTLLGWLAVADIRRSSGRLSGLGLAVFDGLFFPLLALDAFLVWVWVGGVEWFRGVVEGFPQAGSPTPLVAIGAVVICAVADIHIVRRVWRAVPLDGGPVGRTGDWWWNTTAGMVTLAVLCAVAIGVTGYRGLQSGQRGQPAQQQVAMPEAGTGRLVASIPGGGTVELLAIGAAHAPLNGWWSADGRPLSNSLYEVRGGIETVWGGRVSRELLFRAVDLPEGASEGDIEAKPVSGSGSGGEVFLNGRKVPGGRPVLMAWEPEVRSASVFLGYGLTPWRTLATHGSRVGSQPRRLRSDPDWIVNFHRAPVETRDGAQIAILFGPEDRMWNHRLVAIDTNGVEHTIARGDATPIRGVTLWTYTFRDLPLAAVKEFQFQVRPVHWIAFPNVALAPRSPLPTAVYPQLGPKQERGFGQAVDLDHGRVVEYEPARSDDPFEDLERSVRRLQTEGVDLVVGPGKLRALETVFIPLDNSHWNDISPYELVRRIYQGHQRLREVRPPVEGWLPATFGFRTSEHTLGILQLLPFDDPRRGPLLRYRLMEVGTARVTPAANEGTQPERDFGPVQEVAFEEFLDLDTGSVMEPPKDDDKNFNPFDVTPRLLAWMQQNGLDVHAGPGKLETLGVTIVNLGRDDWESLAPSELRRRLREQGHFPPELRPGADPMEPATFGFRTREGAVGVMQFVAFDARRSRVTLRFKLVPTPLNP